MSASSQRGSNAATSPPPHHEDYEDTASSAQGTGAPPIITVQEVTARAPPGPPQTVNVSHAPNTVFSQRTSSTRSRSVSPRPRRVVSPSLSVAQLRARAADWKASTAISSVGRVADEVLRARTAADDAIAEARSVREQVEARIADVTERTEKVASNVVGGLTGHVEKTVRQGQAETSRAVGGIIQQLREEMNVVATSTTAASEEVARKVAADAHRDFQVQFELNRTEAQRRDAEVQRQMAVMAENLATLTEQLNLFKPARAEEVATGHAQLSGVVDERLSLQSRRIDSVVDATQEAKQTAQDNAEVLNSLLVGMENLSENVKQLREEMNTWVEPEDQQILDELQKEVPVVPEQTQVCNPPPAVSAQVPPVSVPNEAESSSLPTNVDQEMKDRLNSLRQPNIQKEKPEKKVHFEFDTPAGATTTYPGLDGHPRRITPISVAHIERNPEHLARIDAEMAEIWKKEEAKRGRAVSVKGNVAKPEVQMYTDEKSVKNTKISEQGARAAEDDGTSGQVASQSSGANRPTIGETTIFTAEAENIRREVRDALRQAFPGIQFSTGMPAEKSDQTGSVAQSAPQAIAGSEVSVASTQSNRTEENGQKFSQMMSGAGTVVPAQTFATAQWRPKEPPCFYGRSNEDVHMWTSLVRHYFSFMGGNDAQQVAYAVTLLRDSAHEWYTAYERRQRQMPRDWPQLSTALLERFGSNIRSQEAQSQLMAISQGTRPVREYASQFETLLGRLDSYDESMLLNQFVWGLQPELARSVSLHYPKSIAQAVSLAETTELAVKASRRPMGRGQNSGRAPMSQNRGRGQRGYRGRGGYRGGRSAGSGGGNSGGRGRGRSGRGGSSSSGSVNFDPLACYRCGVRGHLARDCPQTGYMQSQGSGNAGPSRGKFSQSGQKGPKNRGRGRSVRFGGLNVLYDEAGNEFPVDDAGQLYVPFGFEPAVTEGRNEEENINETKN